jgi:hypothetical protein
MRVYLLRHGKTVPDPQYDEVLRQPNPGLDAVGLRQAELLGRRLQGRGIEAVYSSDLKSAQRKPPVSSPDMSMQTLFFVWSSARLTWERCTSGVGRLFPSCTRSG